jgi:Mannosyl-glycoprotein endo-beta-N-acetylglucosaminidase/LysM domain
MKRGFLLLFLSVVAIAGTSQVTENYINQFAPLAVEQMKKYQIPASITLAQGILESGNGKSELATKANNHFGIKCHNSWNGEKVYFDDDEKNECFRKYSSVLDSYEDHSLFLKKPRYEELFKLKLSDYKGWAEGLKKCGYATSPSYAKSLIELIEKYKLYEYDKESAKGSNDLVVFVSDNRIKYVKVKKGESIDELAQRTVIGKKRLSKYNDWPELHMLKEGEVVYIQPKRKNGSVSEYKVKRGDSVRSVSQTYGIKIKRLCKLNDIQNSTELKEGMVLRLR